MNRPAYFEHSGVRVISFCYFYNLRIVLLAISTERQNTVSFDFLNIIHHASAFLFAHEDKSKSDNSTENLYYSTLLLSNLQDLDSFNRSQA